MVKSKKSSASRKSFGITGALSLRRRYERLEEQYRRFYGRRDIARAFASITFAPREPYFFTLLQKSLFKSLFRCKIYIYMKNPFLSWDLCVVISPHTRYKNKSASKGFIVMKLPCFTLLVTNVSAFRVPHRVYRRTFSRLGRYSSHEDILRKESLCESFSLLVRIDHVRANSRKNFYCRPKTILHT